MHQQSQNIWDYLTIFSSTDHAITSKINPILKKIRDNHINSYLQLDNVDLNKNDFQRLIVKKNNNKVFQSKFSKEKDKIKELFAQNGINKINNYDKVNKFKVPSIKSEKNRNFSKFSSLNVTRNLKDSKLENQSDVRAVTAGNCKIQKKKKNYSTIIPKTADASYQNLNLQSKLIVNPQKLQQFQGFGQQDFFRFKMMIKNPYFGRGKTSKIKRHLIQQINYEQIQKKFHKSPQNKRNYQHFYQKTLKKHIQGQSQYRWQDKVKRINQNRNKNNKNVFYIKEQQDQVVLQKQTYSEILKKQSIQNQDKITGSALNHKKISVRARFFQGKSPTTKSNLLSFKSINSSILVKGMGKNIQS